MKADMADSLRHEASERGVMSLVAAVIIAGAALNIVMVAPVIAEAFLTRYALSSTWTGWLISLEWSGMTLGCLLSSLLAHGKNQRPFAIIGAAIAIAANILTAVTPSVIILVALRLLSGIGSGLLFSIAIEAVGTTRNVNRAFCGVVVAQSVLPVIFGAGFEWTFAAFGYRAAILSIATWFVLCFVCALYLPRYISSARKMAQNVSATSQVLLRDNIASWCSILGLAFFMTAVYAYWSYAEALGHEIGLGATSIGNALILALIVGGAAAIAVLFTPTKLNELAMSAISCVLIVLGVAVCTMMRNRYGFIAGLSSFCVGWSWGVAYLSSLTAVLDPGTKVRRLIPIVQVLSGIIGPALAAALVGRDRLFLINPIVWIFVPTTLLLCIICAISRSLSPAERIVTDRKYE